MPASHPSPEPGTAVGTPEPCPTAGMGARLSGARRGRVGGHAGAVPYGWHGSASLRGAARAGGRERDAPLPCPRPTHPLNRARRWARRSRALRLAQCKAQSTNRGMVRRDRVLRRKGTHKARKSDRFFALRSDRFALKHAPTPPSRSSPGCAADPRRNHGGRRCCRPATGAAAPPAPASAAGWFRGCQ